MAGKGRKFDPDAIVQRRAAQAMGVKTQADVARQARAEQRIGGTGDEPQRMQGPVEINGDATILGLLRLAYANDAVDGLIIAPPYDSGVGDYDAFRFYRTSSVNGIVPTFDVLNGGGFVVFAVRTPVSGLDPREVILVDYTIKGYASSEVLANRTYTIDSSTGNITLYQGGDLALYSDAGVTRKILLDGATGNIVSAGAIKLQNGATAGSGAGSPEGVVSGSIGDVYLQTDGDALSAAWWKASGAATVWGWVPIDGATRKRWESGAHANPDAATLFTDGMSTAWTSPATVSNSNQISGPYLNYQTGAVSGNVSGPNGPAAYREDWGIDATFVVRTPDTTLERLWVGLFAGDPSGSATPAVDHAAFRFDTGAGDASWQARTRNATSASLTASGVAITATSYTLRIVLTTASATYYVNDVEVAQHTTNLPLSTTLLAPWVRVTTLSGAARNLQFGLCRMLCR